MLDPKKTKRVAGPMVLQVIPVILAHAKWGLPRICLEVSAGFWILGFLFFLGLIIEAPDRNYRPKK